ncbi:MAG: cyclic nucleotide-binding domain-containing protein [Alphaproteobacteria bacterium]|nr:cyclic nucleotide-binding domain-containing protein [Alphaproteobacteria bacterium]
MNTSVVAALRQSPLGAGHSELELIELAERMPVLELAAGQALFQAGDPGDAAYVLLQGELEIRAPDGTFLDTELPGALVGEQALLPDGGGARNAAVLATELSLLLRVEAQLFRDLAAQSERQSQVEAASDEKTRNRLSRLSGPFGRLLAASERRTWTEGEVLFEEGDAPDGLHLILAGRAEVVTVRDGEPVHLSTVYPGRVFGEIAALRGVPRTATVLARSGLRTAFVPATQALALQSAHPDLESFLRTLLRSYELPRKGALHQRTVFRDGRACVETVYALGDGRELTALREPSGRYHLSMAGADVAKELRIAPGTSVSLDAEHRVVGLADDGHYEDVAGLQALALDGEPLSVQKRRALRQAAKEAELQAPDALICRCLNLERATLQVAIDAGARTPEALQQATGCGTVCGGCMRKAVPAVLADAGDPPAPAPALPAALPTQLPRMPRLIPWLGNFSFSRDPAGFQRRGHARLGPVFAAHLMGVDFVFVTPGEQARAVFDAPAERLDATGAWRVLAGSLMGEALLQSHPALAASELPPAANRAAAQAIAAHVQGEAPVDLVALAGEAVAGVLLALTAAPDAPEPAALARQLGQMGSDLSAFGALMPLETPAARRRVEARRALEQRLGAEALARLVAAWRNAQLAVVAALLDLLEHPELLAELQAELDAAPQATRSLEGLRRLGALQRALAESIRLRSGGAIWRRAAAPAPLPGGEAPAGALVGAVMELANLPDEGSAVYDPAAGRAASPGGEGALFDERFGSRPPAEALPELAAALVLARLLQGWDWSLVEAPSRWTVPIVPGMKQPRGAARARARAR